MKQNSYYGKKGSELLEKSIAEYFSLCDSENSQPDKDKKTRKPYTLTGLLCYLDISLSELYAIEQSSRASRRIVGGAKRKIEAYIEENALAGRLSATASINSLKEHFGWQARAEEADTFTVELSEDARRLGE